MSRIFADAVSVAKEVDSVVPDEVELSVKAAQGTYVACSMCRMWRRSEQELKVQELRRILSRHLESRGFAVGDLSNYRRSHAMLAAIEPKYTQLGTAWEIIAKYQDARRTKILGCRVNLKPCIHYNYDARTMACEFIKRWLETQCNNADVSANELEGFRNVCRGLADLGMVFKPGNQLTFCNTMARVSEFLENALQQRLNTTRACLEILNDMRNAAYHFVRDVVVFLQCAGTNFTAPDPIHSSSMVMLRSTTAPKPKVWLSEKSAQEASERMRSAWQTDCGRLLHLCLVSEQCLMLSRMVENGAVDMGVGCEGALPLRIHASARNLPKLDVVGWVDPYLKFRVEHGCGPNMVELSRNNTERLKNQRNPDWKPVEVAIPMAFPTTTDEPASKAVALRIKVTNSNMSKDKTFAEAELLPLEEVLQRTFIQTVQEGDLGKRLVRRDFIAALEIRDVPEARAEELWDLVAGPGTMDVSKSRFRHGWETAKQAVEIGRALGCTVDQAWARARAPLRLPLKEREQRGLFSRKSLGDAVLLMDFSIPTVAEELDATALKWLHHRNFEGSGLEAPQVADRYLEAVRKLDDAIHFFSILFSEFLQLAAVGGDLAMILVMDVLHPLLDVMQACMKTVVESIDKIHGMVISIKAQGQKGKNFSSDGAMDKHLAAVKRLREQLVESIGELKCNTSRTLFDAKLQQGEACLKSIEHRLLNSAETRRRTDRFAQFVRDDSRRSGALFVRHVEDSAHFVTPVLMGRSDHV